MPTIAKPSSQKVGCTPSSTLSAGDGGAGRKPKFTARDFCRLQEEEPHFGTSPEVFCRSPSRGWGGIRGVQIPKEGVSREVPPHPRTLRQQVPLGVRAPGSRQGVSKTGWGGPPNLIDRGPSFPSIPSPFVPAQPAGGAAALPLSPPPRLVPVYRPRPRPSSLCPGPDWQVLLFRLNNPDAQWLRGADVDAETGSRWDSALSVTHVQAPPPRERASRLEASSAAACEPSRAGKQQPRQQQLQQPR